MAMMNEMEYRTIGSALAGGYRAAVYCRLSKDDDLQGESASIANQRDMLEKYCEKQGWEVVAVYQDDGFTGLNMSALTKIKQDTFLSKFILISNPSRRWNRSLPDLSRRDGSLNNTI